MNIKRNVITVGIHAPSEQIIRHSYRYNSDGEAHQAPRVEELAIGCHAGDPAAPGFHVRADADVDFHDNSFSQSIFNFQL